MAKILFIYACLFLLIFSTHGRLEAQVTAHDEYDMLIREAQLYKDYLYQGHHELMDSAASYAAQGDFDLAVIYLEMFLAGEQDSDQADPLTVSEPPGSSLKGIVLKSGFDFNRQEFELGNIQSDSLLLEELGKPFLGIEWRQALGDHFSLVSDLHYDKEDFTGQVSFANNFSADNSSLNFETGFQFDENSRYPEFTSREGHADQHFRWQILPSLELNLDNRFRYKQFREPSETIPSFIRNWFQGMLVYSSPSAHNLEINYQVDINESIKYNNNDYSEQGVRLSYAYLRPGKVIPKAGIGLTSREFTYVLQDSVLSNNATGLYAEIENEIKLWGGISGRLSYLTRRKYFTRKTEQDPDYWQHNLYTGLKFKLSETVGAETGYVLNVRRHEAQIGLDQAYIKEQDYIGQGAKLALDFSTVSGYILSLGITQTWRRYPNAISGQELGFYSDRNIFDLFVLAQIPVMDHWQISILASYDNDKDLDSDQANSQSTFFTSELQYRF